MKKTIKEDQERLIMQSMLLNDNTLLEYTADHGYMIVSVRFVENISNIREHVLLKMNIVEFLKHEQELIEINDDKTSIAIFKPTEDGYVLRNVYDTNEHEYSIPDFLDLEYKRSFPNGTLDNYYVKKKTKEE